MSKKGTIEQMQVLAQKRGGRCLSPIYVDKETKLEWVCEKGHSWLAIPNSVKRGSWCPTCAGTSRGTLDQMQTLASKKGGACLSSVYLGDGIKLTWQCHLGHTWAAIPSNIKRGSWCPTCSGRIKGLLDLQTRAARLGGKCLSLAYKGALAKYEWECKEGHRFKAAASNVLTGYWCPTCGGKERLTLDFVRAFGSSRGLECLSSSYKNNATPLSWRCSCGYEWKASFGSIQQGSGCPKCSGVAPIDLRDLQAIAQQRGGACLSEGPVTSETKVHWQCSEGHAWQAVPGSVRNGTWCPECSSGLLERTCRALLRHLTGKPFPKATFSTIPWLINERGKRMELDGFNPELKLAFEYHGIQHYEVIEHFHRKGEESLLKRQADDAQKRRLCADRGVRLIEIPYSVPTKDLEAYLRERLTALEVPIVRSAQIPLESIASEIYPTGRLEELRQIALERGGQLLAEVYSGAYTPLPWRCAKGHEWMGTPNNVKRGAWCKSCSLKESWRIRRAKGTEGLVPLPIESS